MSHEALLSSQESSYGIHIPTPDENPSSSPLLPSSQSAGKRKQPPTVTPKRFTRFFTPRSSLGQGSKIGASRQVLRDITASGANRKSTTARRRTPTKDSIQVFNDDGENLEISRKRRKRVPISPETTPDRSSPLKRIRKRSLGLSDGEGSCAGDTASEEDFPDDTDVRKAQSDRTRVEYVEPIAWSRQRGPLGRLLRQEICDGSPRYRTVDYGDGDWQYELANFMTRPEDAYACLNLTSPQEATIPFCATSCNSKNNDLKDLDEQLIIALSKFSCGDWRRGWRRQTSRIRERWQAWILKGISHVQPTCECNPRSCLLSRRLALGDCIWRPDGPGH